MKKFKKGISLLAVIAFLITALVPLSAMAADVPLDPAPGGSVPSLPSTGTWNYNGILGEFTVGAQTLGDGNYTWSNPGRNDSIGTAATPLYMWKGSTATFTLPSGYAWTWKDNEAGAPGPSIGWTSEDGAGITWSASTGSLTNNVLTIDDTSAAGAGSRANGPFSNTDPQNHLYIMGIYAGTSYTAVYEVIPVQATVQVLANDDPAANPYTPQWGDTGKDISAQWTVVRFDNGSVVESLPPTAPPGGKLQCFVYDLSGNRDETGAAVTTANNPINLRSDVNTTAQNGWQVTDPTATLTHSIETTNGTLPIKADYTDPNFPQSVYPFEYQFYGSATTQTAAKASAGPAIAGPANRSAGPITNMASTRPAWTPWAALQQGITNTYAAPAADTTWYSVDTWRLEQVQPKYVRAIFADDNGNLVPQGTAAEQTQWTLPATMGDVTVLRAQLPYNSYGVWWIDYHDGNGAQPYSAASTLDVVMSTGRHGAVKVTDDNAAQPGNSTMGTSTLQFVVPKSESPAGSGAINEENITVSFMAMTYCNWTNINDQLYTPNTAIAANAGWLTDASAAINAWPNMVNGGGSTNAIPVSTLVRFGLIPSLEEPGLGSVVVTPTTNVIAKDQNATFDINLTPAGGLRIDSITGVATMKDSFLPGTTGTTTSSYPVDVSRVDAATDQWVVNTGSLPVGNYDLTFSVWIVNPQIPQTSPNYRYELKQTVSLQIMQLQGRILNSSESDWSEWDVQTGLLNVAPNQVLELSAAWLDKVYPMAGWPHVDRTGNPTALGYAWSLTNNNGNVDNAASYLTQQSNLTDAELTIPSSGIPAGQTWTVTCQPKSVPSSDPTFNQVASNVGTPVTFTFRNASASPQPKVSGYYYEVTPDTGVFPLDTTMAKYQVSGTVNARNIPVQESSATASAVAGSTVKISPVLSLQNDPSAFTYQWMLYSDGGWTKLVEGPEVSGVTSRVLTIAASSNTKGWQLYCAVTNKTNSALTAGSESQFVDLQVRTPGAVDPNARPLPLITSNPATGTNPVQNPSNVTTVSVSTGMTVTFTVQDMNSTDGAPAPLPNEYLQYQWMSASSQNGPYVNIEGATGPTYSVTATQENSGTYYQCHVVNVVSEGEKTGDSNKIRLTVHAPNGSVWFTDPETTPDPQNVRPGATVTLKAAAQSDNGDEVKYQWQIARVSKDTTIDQVVPGAWVNVTGATGSEYTTSALTNGYYFYRCVATNATNAGRTATSLPFRVNVTSLSNIPSVTPSHLRGDGSVNWIPVGAEAGTSVTFGASATVQTADPLIYTWKVVGPSSTSNAFQDPTNAADATILNAGSDGQLVIDVPLAYNGYSFVCQVSNANDPNAYSYSAVWNLTVWPDGTVPQIVEEPQNITATYIDAYSTVNSENRQSEVVVSLPMPNDTATPGPGTGTGIVLQTLIGGQWQDVTAQSPTMANGVPYNNVMKLVSSTAKLNADSTTATWTAEAVLGPDAYLANGQYRFAITGYEPKDVEWSAPSGGGYRVPTAFSDPFTVDITVVGQPVITQQPAPQTIEVGQQATFTVGTKVEPATTQLTYRWQKSTDGGQTWENCLDSDGTGAGTASFTTVPATVAMQNLSPLYYRCVVQNLNTQQSATSAGAYLNIIDRTASAPPAISLPDGSNLSITEADGVKYLEGADLTVTKDGITVAQLIAMVSPAPEGYALSVTEAAGDTAKAEDAVVGTSDVLHLTNTSSDECVDELVIVVRGDVLGTGTMSLTQLVRMAEAYRPSSPEALEGAFFRAGDLTSTGTIDLTDLVQEADIYKTELMAA